MENHQMGDVLPEGMHDWDGGATCSDFNET